jgi:hypothetical protein
MLITIIEKRRPKIWLAQPHSVPPVRAPRFAITWVTVTALAEKPNWAFSRVGYRSWDPCDYMVESVRRWIEARST